MGDEALAVTELRPRTRLLRLRGQIHRRHDRASRARRRCPPTVYERGEADGADGAPGARLPRRRAAPTSAGTTASPARRRPLSARGQHPARHDAAVAGARAGAIAASPFPISSPGWWSTRRHAVMKRAVAQARRPKPPTASAARDTPAQEARHGRASRPRRAGSQPLRSASSWLLLGSGGGGGWWAWHEGWLVRRAAVCRDAMRGIAGALTPFSCADVHGRGPRDSTREGDPGGLGVAVAASRCSASISQAARSGSRRSAGSRAPPSSAACPTRSMSARPRPSRRRSGSTAASSTLIDRDGRTMSDSRMPPGAQSLLLLVGADAPEHAPSCCAAGPRARLASALRAAVWVGERRWNLHARQRRRRQAAGGWTRSPRSSALAKLDGEHKLLARDVSVVDLRLPDRLVSADNAASSSTPTQPGRRELKDERRSSVRVSKTGDTVAKTRNGVIAALDVGTTKVCCFIARGDEERAARRRHRPSALARPARRAIVDMEAADAAILAGVHAAEQMAARRARGDRQRDGGHPASQTIGVEVAIGRP